MKKSIALTALALAFAAPANFAAADTYNVGMSGTYFPFGFTKGDVLQGFEVDFINAVVEHTGDDVNFVTMSFSGLIGALDAGQIDTIANQITITAERQKKFNFTQAYVFDGAQVVVKQGNEDTITSVDDLSGKKVAVNLGSNYEELLNALPNADDIDIRTYDSNIAQDTALGRVDAFVMDRISSAQLIQESPLPLALAGAPFSEIQNALPFADTDAGNATREKFDAAISALKENGTLSAISMKWFGTDITKAE